MHFDCGDCKIAAEIKIEKKAKLKCLTRGTRRGRPKKMVQTNSSVANCCKLQNVGMRKQKKNAEECKLDQQNMKKQRRKAVAAKRNPHRSTGDHYR